MKSAQTYFYPTFALLGAKLSWKNLFSIRSEILGVLNNRLTGNYQYSRSNRENLRLPIISNYLENYRLFAIFFLHFWYPYVISDNTLTGNYECSRSNGEGLQLPRQINLSKRP